MYVINIPWIFIKRKWDNNFRVSLINPRNYLRLAAFNESTLKLLSHLRFFPTVACCAAAAALPGRWTRRRSGRGAREVLLRAGGARDLVQDGLQGVAALLEPSRS